MNAFSRRASGRHCRRGLTPFVCVLIIAACSPPGQTGGGDDSLSILSYNVENLFDATVRGTEYRDFLPETGWDSETMHERLRSVARAVTSLPAYPDVLALVEIESEEVVERLADQHLVDGLYRYRAFARAPAGAVGVAVLSRVPLGAPRVLQPRPEPGATDRPMLEVDVDGVTLIVVHWKSRRGGTAETEARRVAAARLLSVRVADLSAADPARPILVAGDFNTHLGIAGEAPHDPFSATGPRALRWAPFDGPAILDLDDGPLWNTWELAPAPGTYRYDGRWERIDGFLASQSLRDGPWRVAAVQALCPEAACDEMGRPISARRGGVSDHLPVLLSLEHDATWGGAP